MSYGAIIGDDTLRPLVTVSLQNGVNYANLCKCMQMSCVVIGHVTILYQSDPSKQLTRGAPGGETALDQSERAPHLSDNSGFHVAPLAAISAGL